LVSGEIKMILDEAKAIAEKRNGIGGLIRWVSWKLGRVLGWG